MRVNRNGFLQQQVAWRLGYYPWKCGACGTVFLYRKRGIRRPEDSAHDAGPAAQKETRA
jgi:hypothetical protein